MNVMQCATVTAKCRCKDGIKYILASALVNKYFMNQAVIRLEFAMNSYSRKRKFEQSCGAVCCN